MNQTREPIAAERADLHAVRLRRAELRDSLAQAEAALAAPLGDLAAWSHAVHLALQTLADDFAAHVEVTEGEHGLHRAILAGDLRLANAVDALTAEHRTVAAELATLLVRTEPAAQENDTEPAAVRERGTALLGRLVRHRQRGADLVYEAFATDIGGVD